VKQHRISIWLGAPVLLLSVFVNAHDPSEHMKDSQAPDCTAIQNMDQSKTDMNDPLVQAMMQKCAKHMHGDSAPAAHDHAADELPKSAIKNPEPQKSEHNN
jgi:hypothetical protein